MYLRYVVKGETVTVETDDNMTVLVDVTDEVSEETFSIEITEDQAGFALLVDADEIWEHEKEHEDPE